MHGTTDKESGFGAALRLIVGALLASAPQLASQVASAAVYLASETAGYITGEILHIDGGVRWSSGHGATPPA